MEETKSEPASIPFITYKKRFEVSPEAIDFLSQFRENVGVIAIWGKYRTGKSYLLNRLIEDKIGHKNTGSAPDIQTHNFKVGPTVNACTKGLMLLNKPIYIEKDGKQMPVIVLDTEGLGAVDEDHNHDSKVFLLALLLSSLFIYNSVGTIDENAMNSLSLAINLSAQIEDLGEYFPSFLWVLRDFSLKLEDETGNEISAKMYLDNSLKEQKGSSDNIESKNRIRRMIKHFFRERDLSVLVRPTEEENDIQNLMDIPSNLIREQFASGIEALKKKVYKRAWPKMLNNQFINGPMLADLAASYTKSLNQGGIPKIDSAWEYMCESENQKGLEYAFKSMKNEIQHLTEQLPIDDHLLLTHKNEIFKNCIKKFHQISMVQDAETSEGSIEKISLKLEDEYSELLKENRRVVKQVLNKYFDQNFKTMVTTNLQQEKYTCFEDYDKEADLFKATFIEDMRGKASNVELLIDQIFLRFNTLIYKDLSSAKNRKMKLELTATRERLRISEQDIQKERKEFSSIQKSYEDKARHLENDHINQVAQSQVLNEKLASKDKERETVVSMWQEKYDDVKQRLDKLSMENENLINKFESFKESQLAKEANYIKENNEIMNKKAISENEVQYIKELLQRKEDTIDQLRVSASSNDRYVYFHEYYRNLRFICSN